VRVLVVPADAGHEGQARALAGVEGVLELPLVEAGYQKRHLQAAHASNIRHTPLGLQTLLSLFIACTSMFCRRLTVDIISTQGEVWERRGETRRTSRLLKVMAVSGVMEGAMEDVSMAMRLPYCAGMVV
jgi:hypothetical protein